MSGIGKIYCIRPLKKQDCWYERLTAKHYQRQRNAFSIFITKLQF